MLQARGRAGGRRTVFSRTLRAILSASCVSVAAVLVPGGIVGALAPQMVVSPSTIALGGTVEVSVSGLTPNALYSLQLCGALAQSSTDCDIADSTVQAASNVGSFSTTLPVTQPPAPCPCVVALFTQPFEQAAVTEPITIEGAPFAPVVPTQPASLVVRGLALTGSSPPAEWFGASARRTLVLTLANVGGTAATSVSVLVNVGNTPQQQPLLPGLAPGQEKTYRMAIAFPTLALGTQRVSGQISARTENALSAGPTTTFQTSTTVLPWGLVVIAAVLAVLIVLLILRALVHMVRWGRERRRRARAARAAAAAEAARASAEAAAASGAASAPQREELLAAGQPEGASWVAEDEEMSPAAAAERPTQQAEGMPSGQVGRGGAAEGL